MAYPVIATTGLTSQANATSHAVSMPASVVSGDLLLAILVFVSTTTVTMPAGWTSLANAGSGLHVAYKFSDGTEGGTQTWTNGTTRALAATVYRITGSDGVTAPAISSLTTVTTSTSFDPPSLAPSWGSATTLWFACAAVNNATSETVSVAPTSYSLQDRELSPTGNAIAINYVRNNTTATEDPSAYTISAAESGFAYTLGVRPAAAAALSSLAPFTMGLLIGGLNG